MIRALAHCWERAGGGAAVTVEQSREGIGNTSIVSWGTTTSRGLASSGLVRRMFGEGHTLCLSVGVLCVLWKRYATVTLSML